MSTTAYAPRRTGWLTFAAVVLFAVAGLRLISGIAYISDSIKVADVSNGLFGDDLFWWGLWDLGHRRTGRLRRLLAATTTSAFGRIVGVRVRGGRW